jgi:LDH2 family malate/lactate/ureidoglycolate dehydrogenase
MVEIPGTRAHAMPRSRSITAATAGVQCQPLPSQIDPAACAATTASRPARQLIDALRAAKPIDARQPVLVAGDPEREARRAQPARHSLCAGLVARVRR